MPESLPRMNVGQMYFDERDLYTGKRVPNSHAGVGERGRIDDYEASAFAAGLVNAIDQSTFMIALETLQVYTRAFRRRH